MNLPAWADRLLEAPVGHLATVDGEGSPSVVPICFVVDDDVAWSVVDEKRKSGRTLKRIHNISANPAFTLVVDSYDDDWSKLAWVMLHGKARVVASADFPRIVELLRAKYPQYRDMAIDNSVLLMMAAESAVSWRAAEPSAPV
ncbi:MAG: TIGR03668 family PPOX class F420-dependent oxidoreductase [Dehalococcoidia bacterium]|nr:TIGR03668 family PPOX class F420-dependent oxidoreductase [Dehalococcoidia bacterium]